MRVPRALIRHPGPPQADDAVRDGGDHSEDPLVDRAAETAAILVAAATRDLDEKLGQVGRHLDWGAARIAFYGETNAGKSTLVEALCLLFQATTGQPGGSIGDGRHDFTREVAVHRCDRDGLRFDLLDVPGIEGEEAEVAAAIEAAVHSSHAVFYVTAVPRPPQSGDAETSGTLAKVRRHLRPQANVWAVYNKPISSPRALRDPLATADEERSLSQGPTSLDAKLREALGDRFRGHLVLSALPAFLALADELAPDSRFAAARAKFASKFASADLLALSNLVAFADVLTSNIPGPQEIRAANLAKLRPIVTEIADRLEADSRAELSEPALTLEARIAGVEADLRAIADDASNSIDRLAVELTTGCVAQVRRRVLAAIDAGLANDDALTLQIGTAVDGERTGLAEVAAARVRATADRAQLSCGEAMHLLRNGLTRDAAFESPTFTASFTHATQVDTESGVDWWGLAGSAGGLILTGLTIATGGIGAVILAVLGSLFGIYRSVRNFLDDDFTKQQQRKALLANLEGIRDAVRTNVTDQLESIERSLRAHVLGRLDPLRAVLSEFAAATGRIDEVVADLRGLAADADGLLDRVETVARPRPGG